ncbi:ABC transporter ATP-binding protein [Rubritalea marina]|uniref:ABC transporter ATP-binding protein n=1 Tax=Rubritalea marina TaxID=361055 RepID=UPI0003751328|nr:ABC transporter ATP-binding protein [Rubritalea marina]
MSSITIQSLSKTYSNGTKALDTLDLKVEEGELFFLLGSSGCGKTTLLRAIAGLEDLDTGTILFGDKDVTKVPTHKREAAMVFQSYALWPHMSVGDNVAFGLEERGVRGDELVDRTLEALKGVQLDGYEDRRIDELSGGQQQRVALARALVVRPKCLLLDEPLSNLDTQLRLEMRTEIRRIVKEFGLTAVYVTHDQEEALSVADKVAVMRDGMIEQVGTPRDIYRHPSNKFVADFIGEVNTINAQVDTVVFDDHRGYSVRVVSMVGEIFQGQVTVDDWRPEAGDMVMVAIRPEAYRFDDSGDVLNQVTGKIIDSVYQGPTIQYLVLSDHGIYVQVSELNPLALRPAGQQVKLTARSNDVVMLQP